MADEGGGQPHLAMEMVTLTGEDGSTHIYTLDGDGNLAGVTNPEQDTDQNVLIENDGNVFYLVQSEDDTLQGVSYVVIDEEGNESNVVAMSEGDVQHTELLSNVELLESLPQPSTSSEQQPLQAVTSTESHVILVEGNSFADTEAHIERLEEFKGTDDGYDDEQMEEAEAEDVKYIMCCQCCGEALDTLQDLKDHLKDFHGISSDEVAEPEESVLEEVSQLIRCAHCSDLFMDEKDLSTHIATDHIDQENQKPVDNKMSPSRSHKCQFCVKTFEVRSDLDLHLEAEHDAFDEFVPKGDDWYCKCPYCPRLYLAKWSNKSLRRHIRVDHPGMDEDAVVEHIQVKDKSNLRKLKKEVDSDACENQYPCHYCPKMFHWLKSLARHMKMFHRKELQNLNAEQRKRVLGRERRRRTVAGDVDDLVSVYPCPVCHKEFLWEKSLKRHVLELHKDYVGDLTCKIAEKKITNRRYHNGGNKYFKCLHCSLVSKYPHSIKTHMLRKHPESRDIDMKEVDLPTVDASEGVNQVKANDPRPREERLSECDIVFKCPKCSYMTNNQSNLQRHLTSRVHKQDLTKEDLQEKMSNFKIKQKPSAEDDNDVLINTDSFSMVNITEDNDIELVNNYSDSVQNDDQVIDGHNTQQQKYKVSDIPMLCRSNTNLKVTFKCPECTEHVSYFEHLQRHYTTEHPGIPFVLTEDEVLVVDHMKKELQTLKALECPYCDIILSQGHVLQQHVILNHQTCVDRVNIKQEPSDVESEDNVVYKEDGTIMDTASNSVVTAYRCQSCICLFPGVLDLVRHMGAVHPSSDKSASKTPKKRGRKRKIQETEKNDSLPEPSKSVVDSPAPVSQFENKCPHCQFSCKRASALTFHINFNHANIKTEPEDSEETPKKKSRKDQNRDKDTGNIAKLKLQSDSIKKAVRESLKKTDKESVKKIAKESIQKKNKESPKQTAKESIIKIETESISETDSVNMEADEKITNILGQKGVKRTITEKFRKSDNGKVKKQARKCIKTTDIETSKKTDEEMSSNEDDFDVDLDGDNDLDADYQPDEEERTVKPAVHYGRYKCPHCTSGVFISGRVLERHVKKLHPEQYTTFSLSDAISSANTAIFENIKKIRCTYCKQCFESQEEVFDHMNKKHKPILKKETKSVTDIQVMGDENNKYEDAATQSISKTKGVVKCEAGSMGFKCKYCNIFFLSKASVIKHSSSVHPNNDKIDADEIEPVLNETDKILENSFQCPYCETSSSWKKCIVRHVKKMHPEVEDFDADDIQVCIGLSKGVDKLPEISQFQCPYCQSIHKWKKSMIRHIRTMHPGENQNIDLQAICLNSSINSPSTTSNARGTHLKRLVQCPVCDFKCGVIQKMQQHFATSHPEQSDTVTESTFKYSYLKEEPSGDSGATTALELYSCFMCQTSYTWKKSLMYHLKHSHPEEADVYDAVQSMVHILDKTLGDTAVVSQKSGEICTKCDTSFRTSCARRMHMHVKHGPNARYRLTPIGRGRGLRCGVCQIGFRSRAGLVKHRACYHLRGKAARCGQCGKLCSTKRALAHHATSCQKATLWICSQTDCNFRCALKSSLKMHVKCHHQPKQPPIQPPGGQDSTPNRCQLCNKEFPRPGLLRRHITEEHFRKNWHLIGIERKRKRYACKICKEAFSLPSLRDKHIGDRHKDKAEMCELCGHIFPTLTQLRRHYAKHQQSGAEVGQKGHCTVCGTVILTRNLAKHYLYQHPEACVCECNVCTGQVVTGPGVKVCDVCERTFCKKLMLNAHKRLEHHLVDNGKYKCRFCGQMFSSNNMRNIHMHKQHAKGVVKPVEDRSEQEDSVRGDSVAGEYKETQSTHVIHIGEGQGIQYLPKLSEASLGAVIKELMIVSTDKMCKLPYKCLLCGRCFAKTKYIRLHIRRNHVKDEDQPYRCKICGSGFVRLTEFRKHSRSHSGFRPYKCKICGKAFKQQANLSDHLNIHNANKAFQCFICRRSFRQRGALNAHVSSHDTLKPFRCTFCEKGFTTRGELSRHMQHYDLGGDGGAKGSGARSFMCHICQDSFSHFPLLLKHIEEHHPERPFECAVCGEKFAAYISMYTHKIKTEHFLASEIESEDGMKRQVRKKRSSTRDVQDAVFTIEPGDSDLVHDLNDASVNDSMMIIQSGELYEVSSSSGKPLEVVIEQFQSEEVVQENQPQNENEELLSIAKQLTELSTYAENEAADADNTAALQEEDEIMKDMLDADQDLLANIGKQFTVSRKEAEEWRTENTIDDFTAGDNLENTGTVEIAQGGDLAVSETSCQINPLNNFSCSSEGEPEQVEVSAASIEESVVDETTTINSIPASMEELATLIAENSNRPGESVTAYQTEDGSIIYVCMDQSDTAVKDTDMDVATTGEYIIAGGDENKVKTYFTNQDGIGEEIVMAEHGMGMQETNAVTAEDEDTVDNVEGVEVQENHNLEHQENHNLEHQENHNLEQTGTNIEMANIPVSVAQQLEEYTVINEDCTDTDVPHKVIEYMHDERTFIKEELIETDYTKLVTEDPAIVDPEAGFEYDSNVFKCLKCEYTCTSRKNLNKHLARHVALQNRSHVCLICDKRFVTNSELTRHMYIHTGERRHICKYCGKTFKQCGHLQSHVKSHLGQKEYGCSDCPARFITNTQRTVHWQRQHSTQRFQCDECEKKFTDKLGLKIHKGAVHSGVFPKRRQSSLPTSFQCHFCGEFFARKVNLQEHLLKHTPEDQHPKFICETCGDTYKTKKLLGVHRDLKHSDKKPHICEYCGETYKLKSQLYWHIRSKHKLEKKKVEKKVYTCFCGRKFNSRRAISYHLGTSQICRSGKVKIEDKQGDNTTVQS